VGPVIVQDPWSLPDWAETLLALIDWWETQSEPTWKFAVQVMVDQTVGGARTLFSPDSRQSLIAQALGTGVPPENPRTLLIEAPAHAYSVALIITSTLANVKEFEQRLELDRDAVSKLVRSPCVSIAQLALDCGDPHSGHRSVMVVTFDTGQRLVYKTKNLRVQDLWNSVLDLINPLIYNEFAFSGPQPIPLIIREQYAWVTFLEQNPAAGDRKAVHRFMVRMGCLALIASRLRANDLWANNLITQGDQPYVIDVEALLQPSLDLNFDAPHVMTGIVSLPSSAHPDLPVTELGALTFSGSIASGIETSSLA